MEILRHFVLGWCLLCSVAGAVRLFWPENGFKPVINGMLALYIITAGLEALRGTDWQGLAQELRSFTAEQALSVETDAYREELVRRTSLDAVQEVLKDSGIGATVFWQNEKCVILLTHAGDLQAARVLLQQNLGDLACEIQTGGNPS